MKRPGPIGRRSPMRPRSAKTERDYRERRKLVARILAARPWCEFPTGCTRRSVDVDEPLLRSRGGSILDESNTLALCREHHDWKHTHPAEAHALGIMPNSWEAA